ncbi:uncharacterized protein N7479_000544 [Penicillium vulpinum]|uniref:C2H2-type domain-containing protein n=1 Tax=Penicillium vulpinum TaxID=29845 RepID=A0A1V6S5Y2_9EURO|nr:uncharacterized protein N7479_000544 [Penicillium vulpinum]KAJ5970626.1 hypothetical protein N7479_000544 [Penicillium vulpinum]OQE09139.1 hypothetical protein PENVUL_c007G09541 [Penicillium vulpinum]
MPPNYNDEDDEVMLQWPDPPGSFISSAFTGTDGEGYAYNYQATLSSAGVTSLSSEPAQHDSGWDSIVLSPQVPERPQQDTLDLAWIDTRHHLGPDNIPETLEEDLGSSTLTQIPTDNPRNESTAPLFGGTDRSAFGIPCPNPFPLQPPLDGAMSQVNAIYRALVSNNAWSRDQVSQALQNLETLKIFFHTKLSAHLAPGSSISSSEPDRKLFQCWQCDAPSIATFGSFKRHLTTHGIIESEWRCNEPGCFMTLYRQDRMRDHLIRRHNRPNPPRTDVDATRVRYAPPVNCPRCFHATPTWDIYFEHIRTHCLVSPGSGNASTNGNRSRRGGNGHGRGGNGHGHGSSPSGPSNPNRGSQFNSNNRAGGTPYFSTRSGGPGNRSYHQRGNSHTEDPLLEDISPATLGSRAHPPSGASGQPKNLQPPQSPGLSRANHSTKRKRPQKQKKPAEENAPSPNRCKRCNHNMAKCELCKSVSDCHECGGMLRSAIQVGASSTMPVQTLPEAPSTIVNLDESYAIREADSFTIPQDMPTESPFSYNLNGVMQLFDLPPFDSVANDFMNNLSPDDSFIAVARVIERHPALSELGGKFQESSVLETDTELLRSIGLDRLSGPLSAKGKQETKAIRGPAPGTYTDLVFRNKASSAILEAPQPVSLCQCACVRAPPTVDYEAHTRLRLSPNKRVEVTFKMSPERGNHLRTRVRVFVKLFTLRTSAAKKERANSIISETTSNQDSGYDTDPEQEELIPTSPSSSEDMQDWSISFGAMWALLKLEKWASSMDANTRQNLFISEPGHVLGLISIYILQRLEGSWSSVGRNGLDLRLRT